MFSVNFVADLTADEKASCRVLSHTWPLLLHAYKLGKCFMICVRCNHGLTLDKGLERLNACHVFIINSFTLAFQAGCSRHAPDHIEVLPPRSIGRGTAPQTDGQLKANTTAVGPLSSIPPARCSCSRRARARRTPGSGRGHLQVTANQLITDVKVPSRVSKHPWKVLKARTIDGESVREFVRAWVSESSNSENAPNDSRPSVCRRGS